MPAKKHFKIKKSREDKSNFRLTVFPEEPHSENTSRINENISDGKHKSLRSGSGKTKSAKQVHIAFLPEKYEPLEEEEEEEEDEGGEVTKKKHKYKRYRKNFGKALRYSWKCLMAGLQNLSAAYAGPLSAASTLVPQMQMPRT